MSVFVIEPIGSWLMLWIWATIVSSVLEGSATVFFVGMMSVVVTAWCFQWMFDAIEP